MKGLLLRLSALDADAAAAVRVIAHFQALLGGGLDAAVLVRSTAALAECPAGLEPADGRVVRCGPDGAPLPGRPSMVSASVRLTPSGRVWLERPGAPGPFDELVLEWMAIAAATLGGRAPRAQPPQVADPLLVERVLSAHEPVADRSQALRRLGLDPAGTLRAVAVTCPEGADALPGAVALCERAGLPGGARVAGWGAGAVVLVQGGDGAASPCEALRTVLCEGAGERVGEGAGSGTRGSAGSGSGAARWVGREPGSGGPYGRTVGRRRPGAVRAAGLRAGVGGAVSALEAGASWAQARTALRFTVPDPPYEAVADHDALGPVVLLADVPGRRLRERAEVRALAELAEQPGGRGVIAALAAFCRTGSLRQAAAGLHLHHSSVAARLTRAERALGRRLGDPQDRFAAQLALYAHRLATAPER
ncbi:hypothetical protein GCM10018793_29510 [Streptomyces sulfonofaciens]|uniref:PucR C-terminal helix-turn-helix domain-containing protein n=1 Tax=Streptomyces sulfonofaciens TaxID=68272 RepID=A0A919G5P9_9ACTN|nr:helix-turn-helix domain-containing protein [Streptomyces sulfonofaciens]GHH78608.1 hypothetical protein GCM10018793_29510 [Streptomyces sulfonofaciens]